MKKHIELIGWTLGGLAVLFCLSAPILLIRPMSNKDIIAETAQCRKAGLTINTSYNGLTGETVGIQCGVPK